MNNMFEKIVKIKLTLGDSSYTPKQITLEEQMKQIELELDKINKLCQKQK